ncbi:MAG: 4-hydroxy-3-methylbut-2-enyl diphosphate reductase [Chitinophagales bacterium]|nr:4-hydroxy-3-methylbut-2-enyl diphosphate reductase [Chitinophagales bacterium]MDW8394053.1 4-hydroxy-3-methylbut-2-enyl diphosphate reductase [Chitinophagales bacterium]
MTVTIDPGSGFCFGVVYAIQMAEDELEASGQLYCLGDIVHNDVEVQRLKQKGLRIINHEDLSRLRDCKVLIRAHGEPPETYQTALANNIELLDASCPVVLKLQQRFRAASEAMPDAQLVLLGTPGHAEVNGLMGQVQHQAIIITGEEDLEKIDFSKPVAFFSQTTKSTEKFYRLKALIEERAAAYGTPVTANDTICRQVSNREPQLRQFAAAHEVILFVSGPKSSNGKVLYAVCKQVNPNSYFVTGPEDVQEDWLIGRNSVGICGATSTPLWLMQQVRRSVLDRLGETD